MKKFIYTFMTVAATMLFVSCGNNNGGGNNNNSNYYPYDPYYNTNVSPTCVWTQTANGTVCTNGTGGIVTSNPWTYSYVQYYDYKFYFNFNNYQYSPNTQGSLNIVHTGAYKQFLREALRVCDTTNYNWGGANCDAWIQGSLEVAFAVDSSMKPVVTFRAAPSQTWFSGYFGFFTGGTTLNPLVLSGNTTFNLINNSKGFEIRSNGSVWNAGGLNLIQIQVDTGTLSDNSFNYRIIYPYGDIGNKTATTFATGTFRRY